MQNKKNPPSSRVWLYVVIFLVLFVVLILVLITGRTSPKSQVTSSSLTGKGTDENGPKKSTTILPSSYQKPGGGNTITQAENTTNEAEQRSDNNSTTNDGSSSNTSQGGSYARLGCFVNLGKVCTIKKNDEIFSALGKTSDTELLVNGIKVVPEKIIYETTTNTYPDEQMKDGQGKVLTSTNKAYDVNTKTLTISVGVNSSYFNNLKPTEQRLLSLSQTVRSFMAMFGETSENFVKVARVVNELGSWQPTP